MSNWSGGIADWIENNIAYISVVFSWKLPEAYQKAVWYKAQGYKVKAGGPAVYIRPKYLQDVAEMGGEKDALKRHNPMATIASRGCDVGCYFCIVPKIEGLEYKLLWDFTPRPTLCDNNLSALPTEFQNHIIKKYIDTDTMLLDANSGFSPTTFDLDTYNRWKRILKGPWRLSFDLIEEENLVKAMMDILINVPKYRKRVYVLVGNESIKSCYERISKVIEWGGEPFVQPLMALNTLTRKPIIRHNWTTRKIIDITRWSNKHLWRSIPLYEYNPRTTGKPVFVKAEL